MIEEVWRSYRAPLNSTNRRERDLEIEQLFSGNGVAQAREIERRPGAMAGLKI